MRDRGIGVFDSGLGGLTAVRELKKLLPKEDIIYFGDTGRVPYGTRSRETIIKYAGQDIRFLETFDVKIILAACGTVSTIGIDILGGFDVPILGVVEGTINSALDATKNGKIGIIGTPSTINSGVYEKKLKEINGGLEVISVSCGMFVPAVENGRFLKGDPIIEILVREYLEPIALLGCDTLILGCTHYPLLSDAIRNYLGKDVVLIDSGKSAAKSVEQYLLEHNLLSGREKGRAKYFVSDSNIHNFSKLAGMFLEEDIAPDVKKADVEEY